MGECNCPTDRERQFSMLTPSPIRHRFELLRILYMPVCAPRFRGLGPAICNWQNASKRLNHQMYRWSLKRFVRWLADRRPPTSQHDHSTDQRPSQYLPMSGLRLAVRGIKPTDTLPTTPHDMQLISAPFVSYCGCDVQRGNILGSIWATSA